MAVALILLLVAIGSVLFHIYKPVVVDADRHELGLYRPHHQHHVLDHRLRLRRGHRLHGLLRLPLSPQGGKTG
ncbi:hypothetical protein ACVIW2_002248 [Bradyrhizobium huanghuaihaiense]